MLVSDVLNFPGVFRKPTGLLSVALQCFFYIKQKWREYLADKAVKNFFLNWSRLSQKFLDLEADFKVKQTKKWTYWT